jgi:hypothetical protein
VLHMRRASILGRTLGPLVVPELLAVSMRFAQVSRRRMASRPRFVTAGEGLRTALERADVSNSAYLFATCSPEGRAPCLAV